MPLDISSRLWTTFLLCRRSSRDGAPSSGFLQVYRCLRRRLERCCRRVRCSWGLKPRRLRRDIRRLRKQRFSSRRRGRCWRNIGRFVSMRYCWWQVSVVMVIFLFPVPFLPPYSRNPLIRLSNFLEIPATERLILIYSIRLQFPLPWIAGDYQFITQTRIPSVSNVSKLTASSS